MKRDRLEQFIAENRDQFDLYDPGEKVWNGIKNRVQRKRRYPDWKTIIWRAAAILVIFAASFLLQEYLHRNELISGRKDKKLNNVEIPELQEAEIYYTNLVDEKIKEIEPLLENQPELGNEVKNFLAELDSIYAELQKDLVDNIANDEVVEAMIQNYRLKLQILEDILGFLQGTSKNEQDENKEFDI
jgi:hypothetical protein